MAASPHYGHTFRRANFNLRVPTSRFDQELLALIREFSVRESPSKFECSIVGHRTGFDHSVVGSQSPLSYRLLVRQSSVSTTHSHDHPVFRARVFLSRFSARGQRNARSPSTRVSSPRFPLSLLGSRSAERTLTFIPSSQSAFSALASRFEVSATQSRVLDSRCESSFSQ